MTFSKRTSILIAMLVALALAAPVPAVSSSPRLVLQITVDQLRGDLPGRYADRLTEGGFRYLMEKGTWYIDAHYQHANTETAVGHATLATGADPSRHGIVANDWIDQETGAFVYNTEDEHHHIIGRRVAPTDIAPTLAAYLGVKPPSGSVGTVLTEVLP